MKTRLVGGRIVCSETFKDRDTFLPGGDRLVVTGRSGEGFRQGHQGTAEEVFVWRWCRCRLAPADADGFQRTRYRFGMPAEVRKRHAEVVKLAGKFYALIGRVPTCNPAPADIDGFPGCGEAFFRGIAWLGGKVGKAVYEPWLVTAGISSG